MKQNVPVSKIMSTDPVTVHHGEPISKIRKVFVDLLDKAYDSLFATGEIDVRNVAMVLAYKSSVEFSRDHVAKGHPVDDWRSVLETMVMRESLAQNCQLCSLLQFLNCIDGRSTIGNQKGPKLLIDQFSKIGITTSGKNHISERRIINSPDPAIILAMIFFSHPIGGIAGVIE